MSEDAARELDAVMRAGSKTFHFASRVLPRRVRPATLALYAFCRHADDAVDDATTERAAAAGVDRLRARIDRVYAGRGLDDLVERAFAQVVERFGIPRALPDALSDGMAWDVSGRHYETVDDVRAYGARVAGTVGVMMTYILGARDRAVLARACDLGVAMQMTNIARDVGEDARRGRVYLPARWLEAAGVDVERFAKEPTPSDGVREATRQLLQEAAATYARADEGIGHLPGDCRIAIRAARLVYADIGSVIAARGFDSVTSRAVVPLRRKVWLLARALTARLWAPQRLAGLASAELDAILPAHHDGR